MSLTPELVQYVSQLEPAPAHWQGTGALRLTPDPRDWPVLMHPRIADFLPEAPATASILQYVTGDPYNQGPTGACVAASTCGVCSIDTQHAASRWDVFHWLGLYHEAGGTGSNGVDSRLVLKVCTEQGTPLAAGGREKVIRSYLWVTQTPGQFREEVKACIAAGFPPVVALLLPSDWGWRSGQPNAAVTSGYHQVVGVEYDSEYLVILNSWGNWPGGASPKNGVGSVRWDYLERDGLQHNYVFAFVTTADSITPPPPVTKTGTLTGTLKGDGITALASGQTYTLNSNAVLTVTGVTIDGTPPPPGPLSVTGYSPNPVKSGQPFQINGKGFQGGNLSVSWPQGPIVGQRLSDTQIQAVAPTVATAAIGPVTVRVEGATADGPPLTVTTDSQPPPGGLTLKLFPRRRSATTVTLLAYVYGSNGNPETATIGGSIGSTTLDTRQAQIGSWTITGLPQGQQNITVNAASANGSGTATAVI